METKNYRIFIASLFFVLGFSVIFSIVGILLQTVLSSISYEVQSWLGRIGGAIVILFGIYMLDLIKIGFLQREYKFHAKQTKSMYLTSFIFGAAFAVGWTPCVGAVLGAVLTLAVTRPGSAFFLLLAYSIGLGIPFLLVGLFTNQAQNLIKKSGRVISVLKYVFGAILIVLGIFVFTNNLSLIANLSFASEFLIALNVVVDFGSTLNIGVAFLAGLISFLSPCVLPLIPAFLGHLASIGTKSIEEKK